MATKAIYKADPFYEVEAGKMRLRFDYFGVYETDEQAEIDVLDALCPTWIKRAEDEVEPEEAAAETAVPAADETKPQTSRAKTSGK
ncbi:hypothetical protein [Paenibacillus elgii]|uniref:hypothetical protein n=1 Tax=Paenibacillus elgii TaxID=189691 RepID=UPI000248C30F|nr:hypothetical protein [Paenibacillus elgii]